MKNKNRIIDVCAFFLVLLFVYTATSKLFGFNLFRYQLNLYPWIRKIAGPVAWGLPAAELGIAILLISLKGRLIGFYASLGLLILFTLYLIVMLSSRQHLPCSCGGVIQQLTWRQHVIFNLCCVGIAALGTLYQRKLSQHQYTQTNFNHLK